MRRRPSAPRGVSATAPEPWFELQPKRRAWELERFAERGLVATESVLSGTLVVKTSMIYRGEAVEISVVFPDEYPDVPPTVYGPRILRRHQVLGPYGGNFCLLEQPDSDWWPAMSAAELVDKDLRQLLKDSEAGGEAVQAGEADMPEPVSGHVSYERGKAALLSDPFWALQLPCERGELTFVDVVSGSNWIVIEIEGFAAPERRLLEHYAASDGRRHVGTWTELKETPSWPSKEDLLQAALAADPKLLRRLKRGLKHKSRQPAADGWVAVTFLEEGPYRGQKRRAWVFLHVRLTRAGESTVLGAVRAQALSVEERARRIPELRGLADAHVLVVGAGSLGAPITLELAKAGVGRIELIDKDFYDVNNAVRHTSSTRYAGIDKERAVMCDAWNLNPFVEVNPRRIDVASTIKEAERLDLLLADVDLVIDTTGSQSAARVLQRRCRARSIPLLVAGLTAGSYGGEVALFTDDGPCFFCFVLAQLAGEIPKPLEGPRSNVTPVGCSHPAFSGAGFDATALAALAARTAVCATGKSKYPSPNYNYVIVNFRGEHPWQQGTLARRSDCPLCASG
jgi:molybdopterin/thiamine biosynthesis adenylyltransferase